MLNQGGAEPSGGIRLILKERKGFVKLALRHGADLVPTFSFGETSVFNFVSEVFLKQQGCDNDYLMRLTPSSFYSIPGSQSRGIAYPTVPALVPEALRLSTVYFLREGIVPVQLRPYAVQVKYVPSRGKDAPFLF